MCQRCSFKFSNFCRVLLERTVKSWGIWHTFNAAAAAAASTAAAAAAAASAAAAREKTENGVLSMLSPSRGKLFTKFGNISSRLSNTPRSSPRERAVGESEVPGSFGFFSMNDVTIVW